MQRERKAGLSWQAPLLLETEWKSASGVNLSSLLPFSVLSRPIWCPYVPPCPVEPSGSGWGQLGRILWESPQNTRGVHPHVPRVAAATSASEHVQGLSGMCWLFMLVSQIRSLFSPQAVRAEVSLYGLYCLPHKSIPPSRPDENKGEAKQTANKQKPSTQPWAGSAW